MKLQRTTVVLVGVALLLGAGVLVSEAYRSRSSNGDTELAQPAQKPLLGFSETDVVSLTVERSGQTLQFQRNAQDEWQMITPETGPAEAAAIAFLLSRLNTDAPLRILTLTPGQQNEFGFNSPTGTIRVTLKDGLTHTVVLGAKDFSGNSLYALVDPPQLPLPATASDVPLYLVSLDVANGVERPLAEWKMPTDQSASTPTSGAAASSPETAPASDESSTPPIDVPPQELPAETQGSTPGTSSP